jgi:hypothetical protein
MSRVWAYFMRGRGRYSTTRGRLESWLYYHSAAYRAFYEAELARTCGRPGCWNCGCAK